MVIHHIVLLKFKRDTTPADVGIINARLHALPSQIPAISSITAGEKVTHPLDHDFDKGVILVFKDDNALKEYIAHKAHRDHQELTAPYIEGRCMPKQA